MAWRNSLQLYKEECNACIQLNNSWHHCSYFGHQTVIRDSCGSKPYLLAMNKTHLVLVEAVFFCPVHFSRTKLSRFGFLTVLCIIQLKITQLSHSVIQCFSKTRKYFHPWMKWGFHETACVAEHPSMCLLLWQVRSHARPLWHTFLQEQIRDAASRPSCKGTAYSPYKSLTKVDHLK